MVMIQVIQIMAIDGDAIKGGVKYRVHIKDGPWLPAVTGYNFKDDKIGYAGILGKTIDAVAIYGKTYYYYFNLL